jgi:uncharacterized membrane protein
MKHTALVRMTVHKWMKAFVIIIFVIILVSCASKPKKTEFFSMENSHEQEFVIELISMIQSFYVVDTVFNFETNGRITQLLEAEMRKIGYAFSENDGMKMSIIMDMLDQENIYIKIIIDQVEFTRTYKKQQDRYAASTSWTRLKSL